MKDKWQALDDPTVSEVALYRPRETWQRLDILPFAVAYAILHGWSFLGSDDDSSRSSGKSPYPPAACLYLLPVALSLHLATFFACQWSIRVRCAVGLIPVPTASMREATLARVKPILNSGVEALVPIAHQQQPTTNGSSGGDEEALSRGAPTSPIAGPSGLPELLSPPQATFTFQKTAFWWVPSATSNSDGSGSPRAAGWRRMEYPTKSRVSAYLQCRGYETHGQYEAGARRWGDNAFEIPMPVFWDLLAEHAVAPMFVFQMVCVGLWSLDEYWYYAIFTLVMLVIFESTVCWQRLQSVAYLRDMLRPPYPIRCFRTGMWRTVSTRSLLPGDLVSLTSPTSAASSSGGRGGGYGQAPSVTANEQMVPCDLLLLRGSCIVNEAMLTGESVAQRKDALTTLSPTNLSAAKSHIKASSSYSSLATETADISSGHGVVGEKDDQATNDSDHHDPVLWLDSSSSGSSSTHRRFVVSGGTQVLQHDPRSSANNTSTPPSSSASASSSSWSPPKPPDGGCVCVVLRSGFESSQGVLMRTILFSSERVTANSSEAMAFIGCLLVFAVAAAGHVLREGLPDERRNRFKLYLHCVMIVTSVVPPELPMELSLAVTNSLAALAKTLVYCTEPFRIPLAGKVDVCCFDKTGTLTSDNLEFLGTIATTSPSPSSSPSSSSSSSSSTPNGESGEDNGIARTTIEPSVFTAAATGKGTTQSSQPTFDSSSPSSADLSSLSTAHVASMVLGCCHELVLLQGQPCGDPMELALLEGSGYGLLTADKLVRRAEPNGNLHTMGGVPGLIGGGGGRVGMGMGRSSGGLGSGLSVFTVLRRLSFTSDLKRMSVVVSVAGGGGGGGGGLFGLGTEYWVLTKGAPEVLGPLLKHAPAHYAATYRHHMSRGLRVIALAAKRIVLNPTSSSTSSSSSSSSSPLYHECSVSSLSALLTMERSALEADLTFAGFAALDCPLKRDSRAVMDKLKASNHRCVMITGDGALTAADVGRRVGMLRTDDADGDDRADADDGAGVKSKAGNDLDSAAHKTLVLVVATHNQRNKRKQLGSSGSGEKEGKPNSGDCDDEVDTALKRFEGLEWRSLVAGYDDEVVDDVDADDKTEKTKKTFRVRFNPWAAAELASTGHDLVITGDGLSTLVGICDDEQDGGGGDDDGNDDGGSDKMIKKKKVAAGSSLLARQVLQCVVPSVTVFARVAPAQKELVLASLNGAGHFTLMCGDGTNDVGALKRAHVGVSLLNNPELEKKVGQRLDTLTSTATNNSSGSGSVGGGSQSGSVFNAVQAELEAVSELERADPTLVQLGDASIASPFTSKRTSIDCVLAVVRQGRCTLVTTTQVYKILALNCLVTAFTLSTLYLHGVKQGDSQMTLAGLVVAALFFFSSQAPPLEALSPQRPLSRLFCSSVAVSVLGQTSIHVLTLLAVLKMAKPWLDTDDGVLPDTEFKPNLLNSLTFLVGCWMQLNTFAVNYSGFPFTTPLRQHKPLWGTMQGGWALVLVCCFDVLPFLRYWLELVPLPGTLLPATSNHPFDDADAAAGGGGGGGEGGGFLGAEASSLDAGGYEFRATLVAVLLANSAAVFLIEQVARKLA